MFIFRFSVFQGNIELSLFGKLEDQQDHIDSGTLGL